MTPREARLRLVAQLVGSTLGMALSYAVYRRLGAPRWAAVGFADITARIFWQKERAEVRRLAEAAVGGGSRPECGEPLPGSRFGTRCWYLRGHEGLHSWRGPDARTRDGRPLPDMEIA